MLLHQAAALADTLIVRQVPIVRTGFEQTVFVASGITSILVLVLVMGLLYALVALRRRVDETQASVEALLAELRPVAARASEVVDDVGEMAATAKDVMAESRETIQDANARIRGTVDTLADRVDDLSEMLGRIHASAERVASVAGTAIGGIKLGARALGLGRRKKGGKKMSRAEARRQRLAEDAERPRLRRRD